MGGWFLGALIALTFLPSVSLSDESLAIVASSVPVAVGLYLAWTRRDRDRATKVAGILAAATGALLGGWLGFVTASGVMALLTTVIGATAGGNIALIALEFARAGDAASAASPRLRHPVESVPEE